MCEWLGAGERPSPRPRPRHGQSGAERSRRAAGQHLPHPRPALRRAAAGPRPPLGLSQPSPVLGRVQHGARLVGHLGPVDSHKPTARGGRVGSGTRTRVGDTKCRLGAGASHRAGALLPSAPRHAAPPAGAPMRARAQPLAGNPAPGTASLCAGLRTRADGRARSRVGEDLQPDKPQPQERRQGAPDNLPRRGRGGACAGVSEGAGGCGPTSARPGPRAGPCWLAPPSTYGINNAVAAARARARARTQAPP